MDLKEKVYYSSKDDNDSNLNDFFNEIVKRKRDDVDDWGLQSSIVIRGEDYAAKVNENNGKESHHLTFSNLYQYLTGDNNYYSNTKEITDDFIIRMNMESIKVRMISSEDTLKVICIGSIEDGPTLYQYGILKNIVEICNELRMMKSFDKIDLGLLVNGLFYFEFRDFNDEDYYLMCSKLDDEINNINRIKK